jgi:hypothetical protein
VVTAACVALAIGAPVVAHADGASRARSKPAPALVSYPPKCLKKAGLGHVRQLAKNRWQATFGQDPPTKVNDSVYVTGPYASAKAATKAARQDSLAELAYPGGPFVVTATHASNLEQEASFAAACLGGLSNGYHF